MAGIKIPVAAEFSSADAEKAVQQFRQQMNALGQQIAQANKVKFTPVDKASLDDIRKVVQQFEQLRRIQGGLNQRLKATGQGNAGFLDVDWTKLYSDANARGRAMQKAYEYVTGTTFQEAGPNAPPPGRHPHRAPDPNPNRRQPAPGGGSGGGGLPGMAAGVAQAGLRAAGPIGGAAASALGTGISAGFGAGLMGLMGGLAALAVGKAVGAVREKVGAAEQESIRYDMLKRTLGDTNVSFNVLRDTVRASANALGMNFDEAQRLAVSFARLSNATQEHARTLGDEVRIGGGIGRAFGLDPSAGVNFSAQMRLFGVTENEQDSRRMALLVGETIARASGFSQAGQILQAIASYTEQQTRLGLNSANVAGYAGYLASAAGSGIPGLDPAGSANLLARVNSAIQGGGGGEAGQNFFAFLGRQMGLDPLQMAVLREQGAFGTGAGAFGPGSVYAKYAQANGLGTPEIAGSHQTLISASLGLLRQQYGNNPLLMANAAQNLFGIGMNQAMALSMLKPAQLGGMESRLGRLGIGLGSVNENAVNLLGQIETGNRPALALVARDLYGRKEITDADRGRLESAWASGDDGKLRDTLAELVAQYGQSKTEGQQTRDSIAKVENAIQEYAGKMIPIANAMRAGILYIAGGESGKSSQQVLMEAESRDRAAGIREYYRAQMGDKQGEANKARIGQIWRLEPDDGTPEGRARAHADAVRRQQEAIEKEAEINKEIERLRGEMNEALAQEEARLKEELSRTVLANEQARRAGMAPDGAGGTPRPYVDPATLFPVDGTPSYGANLGVRSPGLGVPIRAGRNGGGAGIIGPEINAALDAAGITDPNERRNVAAMLGGISGVEGAGWNTVVGGGTFSDFSRHPNRVGLVTGDGPSTAAGAFQITGSTWRSVAPRLGVTDFSPASQARVAIELMRRRGALGLAKAGDFDGAASRLGSEWQGLPTGTSAYQGSRSWSDFHGHVKAAGASYDALTPLPESPAASAGGPLGSGLFSPVPLSGSFTHRLDLTPEAQRLLNPLPTVQTAFGPPMPSGVQ